MVAPVVVMISAIPACWLNRGKSSRARYRHTITFVKRSNSSEI